MPRRRTFSSEGKLISLELSWPSFFLFIIGRVKCVIPFKNDAVSRAATIVCVLIYFYLNTYLFFSLLQKLELDRFMLYAHGPDLCRESDLRHAMANCFEALIGEIPTRQISIIML